MKITVLLICSTAVAVLILCTASEPTPAPAAAGTWRIINFSMPNRLTVQTDANGILTEIVEAGHFGRSTGTITVQPNGSFSGSAPDPVSGTIALGGQGELLFNANGSGGPQMLTFHINLNADFMVTCKTEAEGFNDLIIGLRSPSSLQASELAGHWNASAFKTPYRLVLEKNSSNQVINIRGLDSFGGFGGTMTINTNGTMSGQIGEAFTGTIDSTANGLVNLTINGGEGPQQLTLFVNASKDIMALLEAHYDTNDNHQEIMIFQKAPTTNMYVNLEDHWRIVTFDAPMLTQVKDSSGRVTGLGGSTSFQALRQSLVAGYDGFFTARVGGTATGTFSPDRAGNVTVNVQSEDGSETFDFRVNRSQSLLASSRSIGDGYELLLVTRSPRTSGPVRDFGLVGKLDAAGLTLRWATTTQGALQVSTNLSTWETITETYMQNYYLDPIASPRKVYRAFDVWPSP